MMFGNGFGMGSGWLWGLLALVGLVLLVYVIVRVSTGGLQHTDASRSHPGIAAAATKVTPRQILEERYAKGELTTEEYRERLSVLGEPTRGESTTGDSTAGENT
ncbi:MAG: SHOCT domain-containing protein [Terrimesophilobacter sp.]